jgi:integrase
MSIRNQGQNRWFVRVRIRINGKQIERKTTITGNRNEAKAVEVQLQKELAETAAGKKRSLKVETFGEALEYFREHTNADLTKVDVLISRMIRDIGAVPIRDLAQKFGEYLTLLKSERSKVSGNILSVVTRNKLLCYAKTALNLCMKRGLIDRNPLAGFSKQPEEPRDRVLSADEEERLLSALKRNDSYLYWPVRFSLRNPIRKGDLITLTRANLDRFKPCIHFRASKTWKLKQRETVLIFLDDDLLEYFDRLPKECELLFPRTEKGEFLGDFKTHWHRMLKEARIEDFHWHDLKHCAITSMMDEGYNEHDLRGLGIQFSPAMIARYYHHDVDEVLLKKTRLEAPTKKQQKTAN